jgi:hypothetical protein
MPDLPTGRQVSTGMTINLFHKKLGLTAEVNS